MVQSHFKYFTFAAVSIIYAVSGSRQFKREGNFFIYVIYFIPASLIYPRCISEVPTFWRGALHPAIYRERRKSLPDDEEKEEVTSYLPSCLVVWNK